MSGLSLTTLTNSLTNVLKPLPKSILIPFGLKAAGSATGAATQKKVF